MCNVSAAVVAHWPVEGEFQNWIIDLSGGRQAGVFHFHYSTLHIPSRRGNSPQHIPPDYVHAAVGGETDDIILSKRLFYFSFFYFFFFSTQHCPRYRLEAVTNILRFVIVVLCPKITDTTKNKMRSYFVEWIWKVLSIIRQNEEYKLLLLC